MDIIEDQYGIAGYGAWFKLLELLGDTDGHAFDADTPTNRKYLPSRLRMSEETCDSFMDLLAEIEAIDRELWIECRIVWCQNFVNRLEPFYNKRSQELPNRPNFRPGNSINGDVSDNGNPTSKVKEIRLSVRTDNQGERPAPQSKSTIKTGAEYLPVVIPLCQSFNGNSPDFNPFEFTNWCVKRNTEPAVIISVMTAVQPRLKAKKIDDPWGYARSMVKIETSKWNQSRQISHAKHFAKSWTDFGKSEQGKALLKTLKIPRPP